MDDSSFIVEGLIAFLKKKYRTLAAYGGAECLEILKKEIPSVIILDIMMEPMDGWETLSHIKADERTRNIPVLMFSAKKLSPEEAEEHRIRIEDFITKPVSPAKITEAIAKVLARRDANQKLVARWQSAGVKEEKIQEYLTLVTSLEVDLSLCQNMKIQNDLVPAADRNQAEFLAVMDAIRARIRQEQQQIASLTRDMDDTAVQEPAGVMPEGTEGSPDAGNVPGTTADEGALPESGIAVTPQKTVMEPSGSGVPAHEPAGPAKAPVAGAGPAAPGLSPEPGPAVDNDRQRPAAEEPETGPAQQEAVPVPATSAERPDSAPVQSPPPATPGYAEPDTPAGLPAAGPVLPVQEQQTDSGSGTAESGSPPVVPPAAPAAPAPEVAVKSEEGVEIRHILPADPDARQSVSDASASMGAGTDAPLPWGSHQRRARDRAGVQEGKTTGQEKADTPPGHQGLFARAISFVRSLFKKKG